MLMISLLAVLAPAAVQAITAYDPIIQYLVPYTTVYTQTIVPDTYPVGRTATLASSPASATPFSTVTSIDWISRDVTWIQYHFSSEDVPTPWATTSSPRPDLNWWTYTLWFEQTVLTAPSYCSSTTWTHTTSSIVNIPWQVHYQLTPITTITSIYTQQYKSIKRETKYITLVLTPSAVVHPPTTTTTAWPLTDCRSPTPARRSSSHPDPDPFPNPPFHRNVAIGVCTAIAVLLALGFLENYYWFVRLMTGRWALRLGTVSWGLATVVMVCLTRISQNRTPEQQRVLAQRWNEMSGAQKWRLWWWWGFRWKYPEEVLGKVDGPVPAVGVVYQSPLPPMYEETSTTTLTTTTIPVPLQEPYPPPSYGSPPPPYIPHPPPQT